MTANGPIRDALDLLHATLRDCDAWRKMKDPLNPWDQATAAAHIYTDALPPPSPGPDFTLADLQTLRPFALVWPDTTLGLRMQQVATGCYSPSGQFIMQIELDTPDGFANDNNALGEELYQRFGRLIYTGDGGAPGMLDLATTSGYLPITDVVFTRYMRSEPDDWQDVGDCIVAEFQISWGFAA